MRRKQMSNRKLLQVSVYGGDPQTDAEHDYGLNPMSHEGGIYNSKYGKI